MDLLLLNVLLAIAWAALAGDFSPPNLFFGFVLAYLALWATTRKRTPGYFRKVPMVINFAVFFLKELVAANLKVARTVLSPKMNLTPGVVAVPIELPNNAAITLLVNLITLTPGTLALDVSSDQRMLYIHAMDASDPSALRELVKSGYERRVKELFL